MAAPPLAPRPSSLVPRSRRDAATITSVTTAEAAISHTAARQPLVAATIGSPAITAAIPSGNVPSRIPIAVESSRPANQSVAIFATCIVSSVPPAPATSRATTAIQKPSLAASSAVPTASSTSAPTSALVSPNRRLISPPGIESTAPGSRKTPISVPISP